MVGRSASNAGAGRVVIVPFRRGPITPLDEIAGDTQERDEVDGMLDDLFGATDDRGPNAVDGVLVAGGIGAVVAGQVASLPGIVTVGGVAAVALGAILPARSLWRHVWAGRRARQVQAVVSNGVLLLADDSPIEVLLASHQRVVSAAAGLADEPRDHALDVAHGAVLEVASLLDGARVVSRAESAYVGERIAALDGLAGAMNAATTGDGNHVVRRARLEAHQELEKQEARTSVTDAAELRRTLLDDDDV